MRSDRWPPELEVLRAEVDSFVSAALVDEGDPADVPARRTALLAYRARLHRRIVRLHGMLELRGLVDKRGKLRTTWLQQLQSLISTARSLDSLLGLARRQKRVPSLEEFMARRTVDGAHDDRGSGDDNACDGQPDAGSARVVRPVPASSLT